MSDQDSEVLPACNHFPGQIECEWCRSAPDVTGERALLTDPAPSAERSAAEDFLARICRVAPCGPGCSCVTDLLKFVRASASPAQSPVAGMETTARAAMLKCLEYADAYAGDPSDLFAESVFRDAASAIDRLLAALAEARAQVDELNKGESREWVKTTELDRLMGRIVELEGERDTARADAKKARKEERERILNEVAELDSWIADRIRSRTDGDEA